MKPATGKAKKLIEPSLKDSELRYRRLFETAQDGILILDAGTGMIEDVNPYLIKMLGYSREEFVKKKLWEVGAFKDIEASQEAFEVLQDSEYIRYEDLPLKTKDGRMIEVEFVSNVYLVNNEKVIQCDIRDITEHRRIIAALQGNEKKYHDLINQSPDGYFIIELSGNILTVNKAMCKELEFSEEEFLSMNIWDIVPEHYLDQYRQRLTKVLKGESLKEVAEYEVLGKTGKKHYVEVLSAPRYSGKDVIGFQGIARDITARKRAEEALRSSEDKYRTLVAHLPTVVYTNPVGDTSSTLYVSPQIETLLGYTPQEWLADPKLWSKTLHPEDRQHVLKQAAQTDQSNKPFEMEYRMIARDGRLVWVHDQIVLVNDQEGQPQSWQGIMLDITERKLATAALYESEERFKNAFQYSAIGMALVSLEGKWLKVNSSLSSILGYSEDELLTKTFQEITHPDDLDKDLNYLEQLLAGEIKSYKLEKRYFHKGGKIVWVILAVALARDNAGAPLYFISQIEDITDHKLAEAAARESEERFSQVWEVTSDAMALSDPEGIVLAANPASLDLYGYTLEEVIGRSFAIIFPEEIRAAAVEQYKLVFAGEVVPPAFESTIRRADGAERIVEARAAFLTMAGRRTAMLSTIRDITERKQAEDTLQESKLMIEGIINAIPVRVFWKDKNLVYLGCNMVFARDAGFADPKDIVGKDDNQMGWRDQAELYRGDDRKVIESGRSNLLVEEPQTTPEGNTSTLLTSKVPLRSSKGEIIGVLGMYMDITEYKQAEAARQESDRRFRDMLENIDLIAVMLDLDGRVTFCNDYLLDLTGRSRTGVLGQDWFEMFVPPESDLRDDFMGAVQQGIIPAHMENEILTTSGERRLISWNNIVLRDAEGRVIGTNSIGEDITARKQAEEALRESEVRFRALIENSTDAITLLDAKGIAVYDSPASPGMLGYGPTDWIGEDVFALIHPDDLPEIQNLFENLNNTPDARVNCTFRVRHKSGSWLWIKMVATNLLAEPGVKAIVLNYHDITQRKQAEEQTSFQATLLNAVGQAVIATDTAGTVTYINRAAENLYGWHAEEAKGSSILDVTVPKVSQTQGNEIMTQLSRGESWSGEFLVQHRDGRVFPSLVHDSPVFNNKGELIGVIGISSDITERKQAEKMMQRQLAHLAALSSIDRVVAANLDLKLSLSEILGHVTAELDMDAAAVLLLNPHTQMLEYAAWRGFRTKTMRKAQMRLGESFAGRVALERRLIQISNLKDVPAVTLLADEEFVCYFGLPLIAKGQVKGVLEVFARIPFDPDVEWLDFLVSLAGQTAIAIENATLFESLQRSNTELALAYDVTIEGWSHALDLRDKETEGHTQRVTEMTVKLAGAFGLSEAELVQVRWGSLLHDIGKMGVPDGILLKPGELTEEEWAKMREHPRFAYDLLSPIRFLRQALDIPYCHHEKWDGTGYPRGLEGDQIPLVARIFAVVDVWDALHSDRPYRAAWPEEKVREHIRALSGTHFDPQVVDVFMQIPK